MLPVNVNLTAYQGDTFTRTIQFTDGTVPLNIADWASHLVQLRRAPKSEEAVAITVTVLDVVNGIVKLSLTDVVTAALIPGSYYWDYQRINTSGAVRTVINGRFSVVGQVAIPPVP